MLSIWPDCGFDLFSPEAFAVIMLLESNHPLVNEIQAELMPVLGEAIPSIVDGANLVRVSEFSAPVGSLTLYQGFAFGLSCLVHGAAESEPDEVALVVSLCHLDRQPKLNVDVVWGHPSGYVEIAFSSASSSEDWPLVTSELVREVRVRLPEFIAALQIAVRRGHP